MQTEYTKLLKSRTPRSGEGYFDAKRVDLGNILRVINGSTLGIFSTNIEANKDFICFTFGK